MAATTGTDWNWPEDLRSRADAKQPGSNDAGGSKESEHLKAEEEPSGHYFDAYSEPSPQRHQEEHGEEHDQEPAQEQQRPDTSQYHPRTCRICLEVVYPAFDSSFESLPAMLQSRPRVIYTSEDNGRLIRPCLCKGSQKHVHEGCLDAWRLQDPTSKRNFYSCPTCKYNYSLERMTWGRWINGALAQVALTILILLVATFLLGWVSDPIIDFYFDPWGTILGAWQERPAYYYDEEEPGGWVEHFLKGFTGLGLLGCVKYIFTPQVYIRIGSNLLGGARQGARTGTTGRDRLEQVSWIAVLVGIMTMLLAIWKLVRALSKRALTRASERVMDVPLADDDDDE